MPFDILDSLFDSIHHDYIPDLISGHSFNKSHRHHTGFIEDEPVFMLINGISASASDGGEHCLVADGAGDSAGLSMKPCLEVAKDGRGLDLWQYTGGKMKNLMNGKCLSVLKNSEGGEDGVILESCDFSSFSERGQWKWMPNQELGAIGEGAGKCLSLQGSGVKKMNLSHTATATGDKSDGAHDASKAIDGVADHHWSSPPDVSRALLTVKLANPSKVNSININWKYAPKSFDIVAKNIDGAEKKLFHTDNNSDMTFSKIFNDLPKIKQIEVHCNEFLKDATKGMKNGKSLYGIQSLDILTVNLKPIIKDCTQAQREPDARDKWFMHEITEFKPCDRLMADSKLAEQ